MQTLLLTFGLGLLAVLQAQALPVSEEESQDDSETWYIKAIAADKVMPGTELKSVSVTPMTVRTLDGGNLEVKFTVLIGSHCQETSYVLEKTDEPGKFTAYGGQVVVRIIESGVDDHYVLYGEGALHGHQFRMAKLVGRDPEVSPEALEDFEKVAEARGLRTDSIRIPKQRETCSPGST